MKYNSHIKFWLGKIIYFLLCYTAIVGTYYCLFWFRVESTRSVSGPDQHVFPFGIYDDYHCVLFLLISALVISELGLRLPKNWLDKYHIIVLFVMTYLGTSYQMIDITEAHNDLISSSFTSLSFLLIAVQFIRYQYRFIGEKSYFDFVLAILWIWPWLNMLISIFYEDVYDQFVKGDDYAEAIFQYGVPMFFVYPVLFPLEQRKSISVYCSCTILLSFLLLVNVELIRCIEQQSIHILHILGYWMRGLAIILIIVVPTILIPRILYWGYHRYLANRKFTKQQLSVS